MAGAFLPPPPLTLPSVSRARRLFGGILIGTLLTPLLSAATAQNWSLSAEALWLRASSPADFPLARVIDRTAAPLPLPGISLADVAKGEWTPGLRIGVAREMKGGDRFRLEAFSLRTAGGERTLQVQDPPFAQSPFLGTSIPFANKGFDTSLRATFASSLRSAELSLERPWRLGRWQGHGRAGLRHFEAQESLELTGIETYTVTIERTRAHADNRLVGPQLGAALTQGSAGNWLQVNLSGNAGLLLNRARAELGNQANRFDGTLQPVGLRASRGRLALAVAGEVALDCRIRIGTGGEFRLGYQALLIDGLVAAPQQLVATGTLIRDFPQRPVSGELSAGPSASATRFWHGPSLGFRASF